MKLAFNKCDENIKAAAFNGACMIVGQSLLKGKVCTASGF